MVECRVVMVVVREEEIDAARLGGRTEWARSIRLKTRCDSSGAFWDLVTFLLVIFRLHSGGRGISLLPGFLLTSVKEVDFSKRSRREHSRYDKIDVYGPFLPPKRDLK